jgi:uncharacterized membrane protein
MNRGQALGEDGTGIQAVQARVRAAMSRAVARLRRERGTRDDLLRLTRSAVAGAVSHSSAIGVWVEEGRVVLYGDVLADEHGPLMRAIGSVPGVAAVVDHLRQRTATDRIWRSEQPLALRSAPLNFNREQWSPSARIVGGAVGIALLGVAIRDRRSLLASPAGAGGILLLLRSIVNRPLGQLGPQRGVFEASAAMDIRAPVERVFRVVSAWERFPTFMHNVRSVTRYDDGSSHWAVRGPLGALLEWDSVITVQRDNELLAWRSIPGSRSEQCGVISFEALGSDRTRVRVHVTYRPPGGLVGHLAARAGGMDAAHILQNALERLKLFIEDWDMAGQGSVAVAHVAERDSSLRAAS